MFVTKPLSSVLNFPVERMGAQEWTRARLAWHRSRMDRGTSDATWVRESPGLDKVPG